MVPDPGSDSNAAITTTVDRISNSKDTATAAADRQRNQR
jgi:hypothetical protein